LDSLGLLTRKDEKFKESTIYGIMKNEKYIGTYKYGKQDPNSETGDEQIVIENRIPKIVDAELFDKVQEKLAQNKATAGRYKAKRNYLLSGIIRCGECETSMQGNTRRNSKGNSVYSSYGCPNQGKTCKNKGVRRRCLERFVFGKLFEHLLPSVSLERLTDMMNEHIKNKSAESSGEINKEKLELKKIEIQIRNLVDHIKNEGKSDAAKSELADLENRKRLVEGRIEEMKSRYSVEPISKETVFGLLCQSRKILKIPNDEKYKDLAKSTECRNFINSYVESVLVFEDSIKAKFKIKRVQNTPKPEQQEN
jgi:site-specific DNA recombinase